MRLFGEKEGEWELTGINTRAMEDMAASDLIGVEGRF